MTTIDFPGGYHTASGRALPAAALSQSSAHRQRHRLGRCIALPFHNRFHGHNVIIALRHG